MTFDDFFDIFLDMTFFMKNFDMLYYDFLFFHEIFDILFNDFFCRQMTHTVQPPGGSLNNTQTVSFRTRIREDGNTGEFEVDQNQPAGV